MKEKIYLASLLHDIGKIYQRSDKGSLENAVNLTETDKSLYAACGLKDEQGGNIHTYIAWTIAFINKYSQVFNNLLQDTPNDISLLSLATKHNMETDRLSEEERIIKEAIILSSGLDRNNFAVSKDEKDYQDWNTFLKKRLVPAFEGVGQGGNSNNKYSVPAIPLSLKKDYFPGMTFESIPDYKTLWQEFEKEFKFIQAKNYKAFSETFLSLLLKYTSSVPYSTADFPDVSLFDHLKTTASIATCLYQWEKEGKSKKYPFLMIGADVSGIQSYIYNIVSKSAAKNLKGRSLYIKLLSDSIVQYLLKELDLFEANIIYNAGGGFYLLAPNTKSVKDKLEKCTLFIEERILRAHGTSLYVSIDSVEVGKEAFLGIEGESIKKYWDLLFVKRSRRKNKRYSSQLISSYDFFFYPGETGGEATRDVITGEEITGQLFTVSGKRVKGDVAEDCIAELTFKQIELGKKLKSANYWIVANERLQFWNNMFYINPADLGIYYYFLTSEEVKDKQDLLKARAAQVKIISINSNNNGECDFLNSAIQGVENIFSLEFYGGNNFPKDEDGSPKSFDLLCKGSEFKRLGILRMDVDNLGRIFREGINSNFNSFSRYTALSRNLGWFFSGYLNTIWKDYKDSTYIVYSGGDDLFIVGDWSSVLDFGKRIQQEFKEFTCNNPSLSLSGGIILVPHKFPIKKGALDCDEAEKAAKSYVFKDSTGKTHYKSAISFLDMPMQWDNEFAKVESVKNEMIKFLESDKLPKSFLSKIVIHATNAYRDDKDKYQINVRTYWLATYDFKRMISRLRDNEVKSFVERCLLDIVNNSFCGVKNGTPYHALELWHIAARWAELDYRSN